MANGFYGSQEEWQAAVAPLEAVDPLVAELSRRWDLEVLRNDHGWPGRRLQWSDDLRRVVEIHLDNERPPSYRVGALAYVDLDGRRRWRAATIAEGLAAESLGGVMPLLERARELASSWRLEDLEDAGPAG